MKKLLIVLILCLGLPFSGYCAGFPLADVEAKILAGDLKGAKELFMSSQFIMSYGPQDYYKTQPEFYTIIQYFEAQARFRKYAQEPGKEEQAIASSQAVVQSRDKIPKDLHFSKRMVDELETSNKINAELFSTASAVVKKRKQVAQALLEEKRAQEEAEHQEAKRDQEAADAEEEAARIAREKTCGKDYGVIRVGMNISRVQQCYYGEVFLRGQVNSKQGIVDQYTRGDTWLLVKKGRVVAWGE